MSKKKMKNIDMTIKISAEKIRRKQKIDNIHEYLQSVNQGVGKQRNKKVYTRKQKHNKGWY